MTPDDRTEMPAPVEPAWAAFVALERELDHVLAPASAARQRLVQPLAAVQTAMEGVAADPEATPMLDAALDALEDVIEALLRATGWPIASGRGEPMP